MAISAYTQPVRRTYMPFNFQPIASMQEKHFQNQLQMKTWDLQDAATAEATMASANQLLNSVKPWDETDRVALEQSRSGYLDPIKEKAKEVQARGGSFTELLPYIKTAHQTIQNDLANGQLSKIQNRYTMGMKAMEDVQDYLKVNPQGTSYANYALNNLDSNGMRVMLPKAVDLISTVQGNFAAEDSENKDKLYQNAVRQLTEDYGIHSRIQFEGSMDKGSLESLKNQTVDLGNGMMTSAYDLAYQQFIADKANEAVYGKKKMNDVENTTQFLRLDEATAQGTHLMGNTVAYPTNSSVFNTNWKVGINPETGKREVQDDAGVWRDMTNWFKGEKLNDQQKRELSTMKNAYSNYQKIQQSLGKEPMGFEDYVYGMQQMSHYGYVVPTVKEEAQISQMLWDPKTNSGVIRNVRIWDPKTGKELAGKNRDEFLNNNFNPNKASENPDKRITVIGKLNSANPYATSALLVGFGEDQWVVEIPGQNATGIEDLRHRAYVAARDEGYFKNMIGVDAEGRRIKVDGVWLPDENRVHFINGRYIDQNGNVIQSSGGSTKTPSNKQANTIAVEKGGYWNYGDYANTNTTLDWTNTPEYKSAGKDFSYEKKQTGPEYDPIVNADQATQIKALISKYGQEYGVNPYVMEAMLLAESGQREGGEIVEDSWRLGVLNGNIPSRTGAIGIGQFMPATAKQYGVDPYDIESGIEGNAKYMKDLIRTFGPTAGGYGLMELSIAAYNAGPGGVKKAMAAAGYPYGAGPKGNKTSFTPEAFDKIYNHLPKETKEYLKVILPYARRKSLESA